MAIHWHTHDLRLNDNPALAVAASDKQLTPIYIWDEDYLSQYGSHYKSFLKQRLKELNHEYHERGTHLTLIQGDTRRVLNTFSQPVHVNDHAATTQRNQLLLNPPNNVEIHTDTPIRHQTNSEGQRAIQQYFDEKPLPTPTLPPNPYPDNHPTKQPENIDLSTFNKHADQYLNIVSKPFKAHQQTTRLSHHITHGAISLRLAHQKIHRIHGDHPVLRRLEWNPRFQQKLTKNPALHNKPINPYFNENNPHKEDQELITAWKNGETGYPLVDASMKSLKQTGYLNFRMRALTATFFTHILHQPWWIGAQHMHKQLIDAEPGINYYQWQMQSNTTGYHPLRIYNPTKQAKENDEQAAFIKKWVPELRGKTVQACHEPWEHNTSYTERKKVYEEESKRTRQWYTDHMTPITNALTPEVLQKAHLSPRSQERVKKLKEKHQNTTLHDFN